MTREEILKCAIVANIVSKENAIMWGVDCGVDFDNNVLIAMRYFALLELQSCGLAKKDDCEIDDFVKFLKNDKIFSCLIDERCLSYTSKVCTITIIKINDIVGSNCDVNSITIQRIQ